MNSPEWINVLSICRTPPGPPYVPLEDHTLAHRREPSALEGWILEIPCFSADLFHGSTRCWPMLEHSKRKGPKGLEPLTASHLHCTAGSSRSFTAIRKDAGLCCGSRLREGQSVCLCWALSKPKGPKGPETPKQQMVHSHTGVSVVRALKISTI